jgi:hypothetical protein
MPNIHISGYPACGKTSICLAEAKNNLLNGGRVFWLSCENIDFERFTQIMGDIPISNASKFHSLEFGAKRTNNTKLESFDLAIQQLIRMCSNLPTTKLVIIDGWDHIMDKASKKLRIDSISDLVDSSKVNDFEIMVTSLSYHDASNNSEKYKIRAKAEFENLKFENWLIIPDSNNQKLRKIIKPNEVTLYKMIREGIEITN